MRLSAVLIVSMLGAGCAPNSLDPKIERVLVEATSMPSCASSAPAKIEKSALEMNRTAFAVYLSINESCKEEWWSRVKASKNFVCTQGVEFAECSIGNVSLPGQSGIMVMPRRDDMLVVFRYAPAKEGN